MCRDETKTKQLLPLLTCDRAYLNIRLCLLLIDSVTAFTDEATLRIDSEDCHAAVL